MIQRHILLSILLSVLAGYQLVGQEDSLVYRLNLGTVYSADENLPLYGHSNIGGLFDYDFNGPYATALNRRNQMEEFKLRRGAGHCKSESKDSSERNICRL